MRRPRVRRELVRLRGRRQQRLVFAKRDCGLTHCRSGVDAALALGFEFRVGGESRQNGAAPADGSQIAGAEQQAAAQPVGQSQAGKNQDGETNPQRGEKWMDASHTII